MAIFSFNIFQILSLSVLLVVPLHSPDTLAVGRNLEGVQNLPKSNVEYAILAVSASIRKTHDAILMSLNNSQSQAAAREKAAAMRADEEGNGILTVLELYPRLALEEPSSWPRRDYKSLTESRLARDSARVDSLYTKLDVAVHGISRGANLKPEGLEAPVSSGASQGSGEYFTRVGVGSPARDFFMVIDTGSDVTWLQCETCIDCYQQTDTIFNPQSSSTYSPLPCGSPQCSSLKLNACVDNVCMYQVSYGDGSYTVGDFATETLSFDSSSAPLGGVAIGCGHDNEGLFIAAAGLLGLGGGPLSLTSQIKASSLSYCLVDRDSAKSSTLEFNSNPPDYSVTAPLLRSTAVDTYYYVGLTGISVGGEPLSISPSLFAIDDGGRGGVIVDSGTAVTRLITEAYNPLRDRFVQLTPDLPKTEGGFALFDTCYDLSSMTSVSVPTVSFRFADGERELRLPAKNYLIPVDSTGTFCLAFAPTTSSLSIIGNVQQQGTRVHFDLASSQVSFSPNSC
ncbi:Protein ASPARTIC PROTEASE IN GUARD CELL 1 [Dionaea muscipula]